jgi:hypothetical protein
MKNAHLRRYPHPSSLQRTAEYASFLRISGALHLDIFDQPGKIFFVKSSNCSTQKPFINHKASDIISINFPTLGKSRIDEIFIGRKY